MTKSVAIIGGGYSGVSAALNLARFCEQNTTIYLIDKSGVFGEGAAYATTNTDHLLNVPAGKMSAFPDLPHDFVDWLKQFAGFEKCIRAGVALEDEFMPRHWYSLYLKERLQTAIDSDSKAKIICIGDEATAVTDNPPFTISFNQHKAVSVDEIVLAIGNPEPQHWPMLDQLPTEKVIHNPWEYRRFADIPNDKSVFIIGTGLTMVDTVISLLGQGHRGNITALSRHGLLPMVHKSFSAKDPMPVTALQGSPRKACRIIREIIDKEQSHGGDWRAVIDSLRPITQTVWQQWRLDEQALFLRHIKSYWETRRHRIAPQIAERIESASATGQLNIFAGRLEKVLEKGEHCELSFRLRHQDSVKTLTTDIIINCTGPNANYAANPSQLISQLLESGLIRSSDNRLGISSCKDKIHVLGPPAKGRLWEITAIPDIRVQSKAIAEKITAKTTNS